MLEDVTQEIVKRHLAKQIVMLVSSKEHLTLTFDDGTAIMLCDTGQNCCETRYMSTDDDLSKFVGAQLLGVEVREGPTNDEDYSNVHETAFLIVTTSYGAFTCVTHNEHNGYYGGFTLRAIEVDL